MTPAPAREVNPDRTVVGFGIGSALLLVWLKIPPAIMAEQLLDRPVDPLWPNMAACGFLIACGALMDVAQ